MVHAKIHEIQQQRMDALAQKYATTHDPEIMAELKELARQSRELEETLPLACTGDGTYSRDFMKFVHKEIWRIAGKLPRFEKALVEARVPRTFPPKPKDHFLTTKPKRYISGLRHARRTK
jgi:hypothetical protein